MKKLFIILALVLMGCGQPITETVEVPVYSTITDTVYTTVTNTVLTTVTDTVYTVLTNTVVTLETTTVFSTITNTVYTTITNTVYVPVEDAMPSTGWIGFTILEQQDASPGTAWSQLTNGLADDSFYALCTWPGSPYISKGLVFRNTSVKLPAGAVVTGVQVRIKTANTNGSSTGYVNKRFVYNLSFIDNQDTATITNVVSYYILPETPLVISAATVNSPQFGVYIWFSAAPAGNILLDTVYIKIDYDMIIADAGHGADSVLAFNSVSITETGAGIEQPTGANTSQVSDSAGGLDALTSLIRISTAEEAGQGADTISPMEVSLVVADIGYGVDLPNRGDILVDDLGHGADNTNGLISNAEFPIIIELISIMRHIFIEDSLVYSDVPDKVWLSRIEDTGYGADIPDITALIDILESVVANDTSDIDYNFSSVVVRFSGSAATVKFTGYREEIS